MYAAQVSPNGERLGMLCEYANVPPEVYLQDDSAWTPKTRTTESTTEEWRSYDWRDPSIVRCGASDGVQVPM